MTTTARISVEIELGWGFHDKKPPSAVAELSDDGSAERAALQWLLDLCDEFEIPITFNIVGHLLLDSCDGNHDGPHTDGWFDRDPGTDVDTDPLFYFPNVTEKIRATDVDHEVCTHTFSHVLCDEVSEEVLDWEFERARETHENNFVSLVPPRHRKPPYDTLRRNEIKVIRLATNDQPPTSAERRYVWNLRREHPLDTPMENDGVVETHTSPFMTLTAPYLSRGVSSPHPAYRVIPQQVRQRIHERFLLSGLKAASKKNANIHYWTHLYNLAHESQWVTVRQLFSEMSVRSGEVDTLTMCELAD